MHPLLEHTTTAPRRWTNTAAGNRTRRAAAGVALALLLAAPAVLAETARDRAVDAQSDRTAAVRSAYDRGYREGLREGERDARDRATFDLRRHGAYRDGDRGYSRGRDGDRDTYRDEFRRGFEAGYRQAFERVGRAGPERRRNDRGAFGGRRARFDEPAYARGYADGFDKGHDDFEDRDRYDPIRHKEYRNGDNGYQRDYGSKDAYKQSYREGFREGYEDGYRGRTGQGRVPRRRQ